MIKEVLSFTKGISGEFDVAMAKVKNCLDWPNEEEALNHLGKGWIGEEAVSLALYCFLRYPSDYKAVVQRGANTGGDSDSVSCIAGSISGAYLGIEAIPADWTMRIEKSAYLKDLYRRLAAKKISL